MPWFVYILISRTFDTICLIFSKKVLTNSKINPISFAINNQLVIGIFLVIYGLITNDFKILADKNFPWFNVILSAIVYSFSNVYYYKAVKVVEASKLSIIITSSSVFAILTGYIFLGERLTTMQYVGGVVVFLGIIISNLERMKLHIGKPELYLFFCAMCWGVGVVNDKYIMENISMSLTMALGYTLPALLMFVFYPREGKMFKLTINQTGKLNFALYCLFYLAQSLFFYWGMNAAGNSGITVILNLASRILTIITAIIVLKESKNLKQKIFGIIIVVIGLYILN